MKELSDQNKVVSRRTFALAGLQLLGLGVLGTRLAWLQVSEGARYKVLADKNRIQMKLLVPSRGEIVDRYGVPLAINTTNYRVLATVDKAQDLSQTLRELSKYIRLSAEEINDVLEKSKKTSRFVPIEIKHSLMWEEVAKVEVHIADLPGINIEAAEARTYPFSETTAHLIGYMGAPTEEEQKSEEETPLLLKSPNFKVGRSGIENRFERKMRGKPGNAKVEVNVIGRTVRELDRTPSIKGQRVALTIDGELQRYLHSRISEERSASAVVMDAHTGEIYAMSSNPAYDPNILSRGFSQGFWKELLETPGYPLNNKAVSGQYPPASTFKMITVLAGLRAGVINPNRRVYCPGHYEYGTDKFHCWKSAGHGWVNAVDSLTQSCDVYFYEIATELGIDKIAETAREMGLGQEFGIDPIQEASGLVPDKNWKRGEQGKSWRPGETIVSSIGQGYLLSTPLQLAVMTARFVNGGYAVRPWLASENKERQMWPKMNVNSEFMELIKEGMNNVVNDPKGTAKGSRIEEAGFEMGGKTGTAQVKRITMAQRLAGVKNEDLPWKDRHHALFVGYAPVHDPKYVCSVIVEHGIGGSRTAAPIAKDLLLEAQKRAVGT